MSMPVLELLHEQCKEAKDDMRALHATQVVAEFPTSQNFYEGDVQV